MTKDVEGYMNETPEESRSESVHNVNLYDEVPEHLQKTFGVSSKELNQEQKQKPSDLLITYEDGGCFRKERVRSWHVYGN